MFMENVWTQTQSPSGMTIWMTIVVLTPVCFYTPRVPDQLTPYYECRVRDACDIVYCLHDVLHIDLK